MLGAGAAAGHEQAAPARDAPARAAPDSVTGLASPVGKDRIRAFDLARGLAVVFMVDVHVLWHWGSPATWSTPIGLLISFLGGPTAAPTFMFLMGASLAFSSRSTFSWLAARGAWLVVLGYLLNLLRGVIPSVIGLSLGFVTADQIAPFTPWYLATTVDIHQMAGLSLIAIAILGTRVRPGWWWLALGAALVVAAPWLRTLQLGTAFLDGPLTPVIGSADNVYYALVPWLCYPLAGAVFGTILRKAPDRVGVFRRGGLVGLGLLVLALPLVAIQHPDFGVATYWHEPLAFVVGISGIILVWLAACDVLTRRAWLDRRLGILYGWSRRVIPMYFTHWILVGWGIGITGFRDLALALVLPSMFVAIFLTAKLSRIAVGLESTPGVLIRLFSWRPRRPGKAEVPASAA